MEVHKILTENPTKKDQISTKTLVIRALIIPYQLVAGSEELTLLTSIAKP